MFRYIKSLRMAAHTATIAHAGQFRKNKTTPYIVHPASVAQLVLMYNPECYLGAITAWLHDVVEDCGKKGAEDAYDTITSMPLEPYERLAILHSVEALTKDDTLPNRAIKWEDCLRRFLADDAPQFTILVKICDRIDNLMDMDGFAPGFEKIYIAETDMMIRAISRRLLDKYEQRAFSDLKRLRDVIVERDNI